MAEETATGAGAPESSPKPKKEGAAEEKGMPKKEGAVPKKEKVGENGKKGAAGTAAKRPKKAKPKAAPRSAKLPRSIALLVALVVLLAAAAYIASIPPEPDEWLGDDWPVEWGFVQARMLYSNECKACNPYHSFELVLEANDINYGVEKIDVDSEQGKALVYRYGIRSVPALIIDEAGVGSELYITTAEGAVLQLKPILAKEIVGDAYVIYESRKNPLISVMYLNAQDPGCIAGAKPVVELFSEPYCYTCITSSRELESALGTFGDAVAFRYHYYPVFAQGMLEFVANQERVDSLADKFICAAELGKYAELEGAFIDLYCDKHGDGISNQEEVSFCHMINPRYGAPLSIDDTEAAIDNSGIDRAELTKCLRGIEFRRGLGIEKAPLYEITADAVLPMAVIDCRHVVHAVNLGQALCTLHPELSGCEQIIMDVNA